MQCSRFSGTQLQGKTRGQARQRCSQPACKFFIYRADHAKQAIYGYLKSLSEIGSGESSHERAL